MIEIVAFYTFSILTVGMFYITVTTNNAIYSLSSLAAGMIFISGYFFTLGADFLGAVQIVVYTGAVMALYAFGMMFLNTTQEIKEKHAHSSHVLFLAVTLSVLLVGILSFVVTELQVPTVAPIDPSVGNSEAVGLVLFTKYLVPFEVAAVMLLAAMIAGIVLAGKKMDESLTLNTEEEVKEFDTKAEL